MKVESKISAAEKKNKWWSDRCNGLHFLCKVLKAENDNLKEKLKSRDLNIQHLTDLLDQIEEVVS